MREEKLNFGIIIRVFVSLLPILLGMPTLATIFCAYTVVMSFIAFGPLTTFVSSLCAVAISMFLSSSFGMEGKVTGLVLALQAVLCAGGCIKGLLLKKDFYYGLSLSTLGILIPQAVYTNSVAHKNGMSLADMIVPSVEDFKMMMAEALSTLQKGAQEALPIDQAAVEKIVQTMREITVLVIPSLLIIEAMVLAYVVLWAISARLRRISSWKGHSFACIKIPKVASVLAIALVFITAYAFKIENTILNTITLNMLIVLLTMTFFAGISLSDFYLRKVIPFKVVRVILHGVIAFNIFPVYILVALLDSFFDFRKFSKNVAEKGGGAFETEK